MSKLYREISEWIDPEIVARKLIEVFGEPGLVWLDSDGTSNLGNTIGPPGGIGVRGSIYMFFYISGGSLPQTDPTFIFFQHYLNIPACHTK